MGIFPSTWIDGGDSRIQFTGTFIGVCCNDTAGRAGMPISTISTSGSSRDPGSPSPSTVFPVTMEVDYVRVYSGGA